MGRRREAVAGAGRMEEEEEVGKVGRVALDNAAIYPMFTVNDLVLTG